MDESVIGSLGLLKDLGASEPSGPNLEYDPHFVQMVRELEGKPSVQYGTTFTPAVPPDWKVIASLCADLDARTYDLRVAVPNARALLHLEGASGFARGLAFISELLEQRWNTVHPQLDPEDGNDPTERVTTLAELVSPSTVLPEFATTTLISSRAHGRFSLRDIDAVTIDAEGSRRNDGASETEESDKPSLARIETAIREADEGWMSAVLEALDIAFAHARSIERILTERVGVSQSIDMAPLTKLLKRAHAFLAERATSAEAAASTTGESEGLAMQSAAEPHLHSEFPPVAAMAAVPPAQVGQPVRRPDEICDRDDVVRCIDRLCAYYARHEPSSPVPILLERAKRLVAKNFFEIMEDLAPEGVAQLNVISGPREQPQE